MYSDPTPAKVRGGAAAAAQSHGGFVTPRSSRTSAAPVVGCLPLSRLLLPLLVMVSCFPLLAADSTQYVYTPSTTCTYANNLDLQDKLQQCCGIKTSIIVDGAVEKIKSKAFYGCSTVTSVDLAAAALLLSIGSEAFYGTSIVSLDFSPLVNLSTVGDYAFKGMSKLVSVKLGVALTSIGSYCFQSCGKLETIDFSTASSLTTIKSHAFRDSGLKHVDFSGATKMTTVGSSAFYRANKLVSVKLGGTITSIGSYAFSGYYDRSSLQTIDFSGAAKLTTIGSYAFRSCKKLIAVDMSGATKLTKIDSYAFQYSSKLATVKLASSITTIGASAFTSTKITAKTADFNGVNCLAVTTSKPFSWACPNIPSFPSMQSTSGIAGVSKTFNFTFSLLIDSATTRPHMKLVAPSASCGSGVANALPGSVSQIVSHTETRGTVTMTIGNVVTNARMCYRVGSSTGAFTQVGATMITFTSIATTTYTYNTDATCTYNTNLNRQCCGTATHIFVDAAVTTIKSMAFYGCSTVTSIDFAAAGALLSIGSYAFQGSSIVSLDFSPLVKMKTVGDYAFKGMSKLVSVNVSSTLTSIGSYCFQSCGKLETIDFSTASSLTTIKSHAFRDSGLKHVDFSGATKMTTVGSSAFYRANKLVSVKLGGTITSIGSYAFSGYYDRSSLQTIDFSGAAKLTTIGSYAFRSCKKLIAVDMSGATKLTKIDSYAFQYSSKLATVKLASSITTIGASAFTSTKLKTPGTVDFNGVNCGAAIKSAGTSKPFSWICPNIPAFVPTQSTFFVKGVPKSFNFTFSLLIDSVTTRPYFKLILPGASCGSGVGNAIPGSSSQIVSHAATHGLVTMTVTALLTNGRMCYSVGSNTGAYTQMGNTMFTVSATATATYVYNTDATCTYSTNLNKQCCGTATHIFVDAAVTTIKSKAFYGCSTVTSIDFAAAALLLSIGSEAFYGTSIVSLDLSANLKTAGDNAFKGMSKLVLVNVSSTLTSIGSYCFQSCGKLETIDFSTASSLTTIKSHAFRDSGLKHVDFSGATKMTTVGSSAFYRANKLVSVKLGGTITSIGSYAFSGYYEEVRFKRSTLAGQRS